MEQEIFFVNGEGGQERVCRILRFHPNACAVVLMCGEESFLLGDVRRVAPEYRFAPTSGEAGMLGISPEDPIDVFCRVAIPGDMPQNAGFDLGRLVLVHRSSKRALAVRRPGAPLVPFAGR